MGLVRDPLKHYYRLDGKYIPSVTTIMKPLYNAEYGAVDPDVLKAAGVRGTAVHEAIDLYFATAQIDIQEDWRGYMDAFQGWMRDWFYPVPEAVEVPLSNPALWYAGTADLIFIRDGARYLVDFKTSSKPVEYLTRVQLAAYARAYTGSLDYTMEVLLRPNGEYEVHKFPVPDKEAWEVFLSLLKVQNFVNKMKRG